MTNNTHILDCWTYNFITNTGKKVFENRLSSSEVMTTFVNEVHKPNFRNIRHLTVLQLFVSSPPNSHYLLTSQITLVRLCQQTALPNGPNDSDYSRQNKTP